jgi:hypothetical protein
MFLVVLEWLLPRACVVLLIDAVPDQNKLFIFDIPFDIKLIHNYFFLFFHQRVQQLWSV